MDDPGSLTAALASILIVAVGAAVQGSVGFGLALVASPLLVLVDPRLVPGPMIFASMLMVVLTAWRDRSGIDVSHIGWGVLGRLPGVAAGSLLVASVTQEVLSIGIATAVFVGVGLSVSGLHLRPRPGVLLGAGLVSGFMGTLSAIGGPPIALVYQHETGQRLRGTLAGYFVVGGVTSLAGLWWVGEVGARELAASAVLLPGIVAGFLASSWLVPIVDRGYTRIAVLGTSLGAGLLLLLRQLW